jgi:hypothetical protein
MNICVYRSLVGCLFGFFFKYVKRKKKGTSEQKTTKRFTAIQDKREIKQKKFEDICFWRIQFVREERL